jgi:hypothetical protein
MIQIKKLFKYCDINDFFDLNDILDLMLNNYYERKNGDYFWTGKPKKDECLSKKQYKEIGNFLIEIGVFTEYCKHNRMLPKYTINYKYLMMKNHEVIKIIKLNF